METLVDIIGRLNAPKGQFNNFGKYSYRNLEDIEQALKPLLVEHKALTNIDYNIVERNGKNYIEAIATYMHGDFKISSKAYARESEAKKGMDDSQITGSSQSYAGKYAMCALFLIDDNKDADSNEHTATRQGQGGRSNNQSNKYTNQPQNGAQGQNTSYLTQEQVNSLHNRLKAVAEKTNRDYAGLLTWLQNKYQVTNLNQVLASGYNSVSNTIAEMEQKAGLIA